MALNRRILPLCKVQGSPASGSLGDQQKGECGGRQTERTANEVTTDSAPTTASACEPYGYVIEQGLLVGRNAMSIWQELVDQHDFSGAYESVKRYVRKQRGTQTPEARAVITTAPGEEAQVDYGTGPIVRDGQSGKYRRTRLFVLTLGYSRKSVRLLSFQSSSRIWSEFHKSSFRRLGGVPRIIVLDNLREGVLTPDIYDPVINPLFGDLLKHLWRGSDALPCARSRPEREGGIRCRPCAEDTPERGNALKACWPRKLTSISGRSVGLTRAFTGPPNGRSRRCLPKRSRLFAEEKPALQALPIEPFRYYQHGERTVHLDGCVEVEAAYYSTPPGWNWTACICTVGWPSCSRACSGDRAAITRTSTAGTRPASDCGCRPAQT